MTWAVLITEDEVEERRESYVYDAALARLLDGGEVDSKAGSLTVEMEAAQRAAKDYGLKFVTEVHSP